jgi:hypothetical protein
LEFHFANSNDREKIRENRLAKGERRNFKKQRNRRKFENHRFGCETNSPEQKLRFGRFQSGDFEHVDFDNEFELR